MYVSFSEGHLTSHGSTFGQDHRADIVWVKFLCITHTLNQIGVSKIGSHFYYKYIWGMCCLFMCIVYKVFYVM